MTHQRRNLNTHVKVFLFVVFYMKGMTEYIRLSQIFGDSADLMSHNDKIIDEKGFLQFLIILNWRLLVNHKQDFNVNFYRIQIF